MNGTRERHAHTWLGLCLALLVGHGGVTAQETIYYERDGTVVVEAEDFVEQIASDTRQWYIVNRSNDGFEEDEVGPDVLPLEPLPEPDDDKLHADNAGGGTYIEILPDTRTSAADPLINGVNFTNTPGHIAVISYKVHFTNPGRYYVWARIHSTGTDDNGVHVGLDGEWPSTGRRMQWCNGKFSWYWDSRQRTNAAHCGVPYMIYLDVEESGMHTVQFSMREDGFEMDRWMMTKERLSSLKHSMGPDSAPYKEKPETVVRQDAWGRIKEEKGP